MIQRRGFGIIDFMAVVAIVVIIFLGFGVPVFKAARTPPPTIDSSLVSVYDDWAKRTVNSEHDWDIILSAIQAVETGGEPNNGIGAVGDGGKAIGPLQIHKNYWIDAHEFTPKIGGKYQDCMGSVAYSRLVVRSYMNRYLSNMTFEAIARTHQGGPDGMKKDSTQSYWYRVIDQLESK